MCKKSLHRIGDNRTMAIDRRSHRPIHSLNGYDPLMTEKEIAMLHLAWLRGLTLGTVILASTCVPVVAQVPAVAEPPAPRLLCIERLWIDRSGAWNGRPAPTLCAVIKGRGLMDAQLDLELELRDAAGNPVRAVAAAPAAWRDGAGHFRLTGQDRVRFDPAYWNPSRFLVPEGVLDLPANRQHPLRATLRVRCGGLHASIEQRIAYPPGDQDPAAGGLHLVDLVTETNVSNGPERNVAGMGDDPRRPSTWAAPRIHVSATIARQPAVAADAHVELRLFHPDGQPVWAASPGAAAREPEPFVRSTTLRFGASQSRELVQMDVGCEEIQLRAGFEHPVIVDLRAADEFTRVACQYMGRVRHFSSGPAATADPASQRVDTSAGPPSATLSAGADRDEGLLAAAAAGAADRIRTLMAQGADPTLRDGAGRTPLHLAAAGGHVEAAEELLAAGPPSQAPVEIDVTGGRPLNLFSPEYGSQQKGAAGDVASRPSFEAYLARRQVLEATDMQGRTPLHLAAAAGRVEMIRLLCERGAAVDMADERGATPLHLAASFGRAEAVAGLLAGGAYANARTHAGCTALDLAAGEPARQILKQACEKLSQGPEASAVRQRTGEFLHSLAAGAGGRVAQFVTADLAMQAPMDLETARFEFRVLSAEVHGETGRARAWLKVPDIEAETDEFIADLLWRHADGLWRVAEIRTRPFFPSLETLEDRR
ncbi:MAG: ankyrin repeat domain-containing protein [Sedimentisphaerales bacterium]|nr:ankyrin repeat domain-containing protein [Sedimentisphaerales bacterium]